MGLKITFILVIYLKSPEHLMYNLFLAYISRLISTYLNLPTADDSCVQPDIVISSIPLDKSSLRTSCS